jgi:hypothetical protein
MTSRVLLCRRCRTPLKAETMNGERRGACRVCGTLTRAWLFSAFFRDARPAAPPTSAPDGDAVCFYHESKSAVVACDECGRFLCSLCELTIGTSRLCSSCLERQRSAGSHDLPIAVRVVRYDRIVLTIAMFSWLTGPFGLLAVLALSLWHRKKWLGPLGIGQYRYGLAVLVALATFLVVWGAVVLLISRIETPRWI